MNTYEQRKAAIQARINSALAAKQNELDQQQQAELAAMEAEALRLESGSIADSIPMPEYTDPNDVAPPIAEAKQRSATDILLEQFTAGQITIEQYTKAIQSQAVATSSRQEFELTKGTKFDISHLGIFDAVDADGTAVEPKLVHTISKNKKAYLRSNFKWARITVTTDAGDDVELSIASISAFVPRSDS